MLFFLLEACILGCYGLVEQFVDYPGRTIEVEVLDVGFRGGEEDVVVEDVADKVVRGFNGCNGFRAWVLGVVSLLDFRRVVSVMLP